MDLNGIILLSQILSFDNSIDGPKWNPGVDQAYALALPTFAATAFYHHKLPTQPAALEPFLAEVEQYALGDYMSCAAAGHRSAGGAEDRRWRRSCMGIPGCRWRICCGRICGFRVAAFSKQLQLDDETTTGRLDARYKGPDLDPLSADAEYDPQSNAISSAYTAAMNQYMRTELKYGTDQTYKPGAYADCRALRWDLQHQAPGGPPAASRRVGRM